MRRRLGLSRHRHPRDDAVRAVIPVFDSEIKGMAFSDPARDRQAQPGAVRFLRSAPIEAIEDSRFYPLRQSPSRVQDFDNQPPVAANQRYIDPCLSG